MNPWQRPQIKPRSREAADVAHTARVLALLDARLASHGAESLPAWLRANIGGMGATDRVCALQRVMRAGLHIDVLYECRAVLS